MKHNLKITIVLIAMFIITQLIGLWVIHSYSPVSQIVYSADTGENVSVIVDQPLPYGMQPPENSPAPNLISIIISFVIAIAFVLLLTKFKFKFFMKGWFFVVVALALAIVFNAVFKNFLASSWIIALIISVPLAFYKVYKPHFIVHNLTELLVYPGIGAVFVPILSIWTLIILLILISIYDMWAVWHSGVMQKMAKFQMNELKIFGGFFVPYLTKEVRDKIKKMRLSKSKNKNKKIKISMAILGGGDVVFPLIAAGVVLRLAGIIPALLVTLGATLSLIYLLLTSEKKKFYPAMPFLTVGIFLGLLAAWAFGCF